MICMTTSFSKLLSLEGKGAVVTGAARGIGLAISRRLQEAGARVLVADIEKSEEGDIARQADAADLDDMLACAKEAKKEFGSLDIWVNNAGIFPPQDPLDVSVDDFEKVLHVNLVSAQVGCKVAAEEMMEQKEGGVIINIASTAAFHYAGAYAASKWGIRGLTKGLAATLGPEGIRVLAVAPTLIETPGIEEMREKTGGEQLDALVRSLPLGRAGQVDDVARVVLFLASPAASFMTGATVPVDGGELSL